MMERTVLAFAFPIALAMAWIFGWVIDGGRRDGLTIFYVPAAIGLAWVIVPVVGLALAKATGGMVGGAVRVGVVLTALMPIVVVAVAGRD